MCTREKPPEKIRILVKSTQKRAVSASPTLFSMASRGIVFVALLLRRAHGQRITRASAQRYPRPSSPLCDKLPTASAMLSPVLPASPFLRTGQRRWVLRCLAVQVLADCMRKMAAVAEAIAEP